MARRYAAFTLACCAAPAAGDPGWPVGWGFAAHGGFPPLPPAWRSYDLARSTAGYFLGNATGMDSGAELRAEDRLGIVGIGWQLNNVPSHYSNLEHFELEEARKLKALRPGVRVMLSRESEATTVFYNSSKGKMYDPRTQDWWVQCGGAPCKGLWYSPAGNTPKYWFNFSNPDAADWWVNEFIGGPLDDPLIDGIYFDSAPVDGPPDHGTGQGGGPGRADAQAAFDRALALIEAKGKWASAWNNDGQGLFPKKGLERGDGCASTVRGWVRRGREAANTLQVQTGTNTPRNTTIAAFLIARGASAVLEFPVLGTYGAATSYGWPPILEADFGEPAGDALEVHPGVFRREWTKAAVALDCNTLDASFDFRRGAGAPR